jgi:hypothetical protein
MNFYPNPSGLHHKDLFSFLSHSKMSRNPLFEAISLPGPTGPHEFSFESRNIYSE